MASPGRQYDEACSTAGPLNPRCVTSNFSRNIGPRFALHDHIRGDSGQLGPALLSPRKQQRDQRGPGLNHLQPELPRQVVCESGCAHLRNRQSAGSNDESTGRELARRAADTEFAGSASRHEHRARSSECPPGRARTPPAACPRSGARSGRRRAGPSVFSCHRMP